MSMNRHSPALASLLALCAVALFGAQARAAQSDARDKKSEAPAAENRAGWQGRPLDELRDEQRRASESPLANYNLGAALYEAGRYEEAVGFLTRAAALDEQFAAPRRMLGLAYFKLARFADAAEAFRRLTRLSPRLAEGHNNLGVALASAGKYKEAAAALREAIALTPSYTEARFNLGSVLVGLNERAAAEEQHTALLRLDAALAGRLFRVIHRDKLVEAGSR
jgi:tetratricopeptide (TPR) repeat protein